MKRINHSILPAIVLATISISSCVVGKKYTSPDLQAPSQYRSQAVLTGDTTLLPWKSFFNDPLLTTLIDSALQKNNDVSIAVKNMEQLDISYRQARHTLMPTLNLTAGANRNWQSKNSLNGSLASQFTGSHYIDDYSANLQLSWEADIWGKAKMQKESAKAAYFAQTQNLQALKTRLIAQVAQAYFALIAMDKQLDIANRNTALSDSTLQMMKLQFEAGQINSLAVEQAEAQKKTAELLVPLYKQNIEVQENALSLLCGFYPGKIDRNTSLQSIVPEKPVFQGVPARLLSRRPDLKMAEAAVVQANAKTGLARADMYPSFTLSPQIGANSFKLNSWFDLPGSLTKTLAVNLSQPLLQKRALRSAYEIAAKEQEKTVIQFRAAMMTAVSEVSDAMARAEGARQRLTLTEKRNEALAKATRDATLLFKNGMATYLDVITAQNNLLQNELDVISVKQDELTALTDLYRSLGGGTE